MFNIIFMNNEISNNFYEEKSPEVTQEFNKSSLEDERLKVFYCTTIHEAGTAALDAINGRALNNEQCDIRGIGNMVAYIDKLLSDPIINDITEKLRNIVPEIARYCVLLKKIIDNPSAPEDSKNAAKVVLAFLENLATNFNNDFETSMKMFAEAANAAKSSDTSTLFEILDNPCLAATIIQEKREEDTKLITYIEHYFKSSRHKNALVNAMSGLTSGTDAIITTAFHLENLNDEYTGTQHLIEQIDTEINFQGFLEGETLLQAVLWLEINTNPPDPLKSHPLATIAHQILTSYLTEISQVVQGHNLLEERKKYLRRIVKNEEKELTEEMREMIVRIIRDQEDFRIIEFCTAQLLLKLQLLNASEDSLHHFAIILLRELSTIRRYSLYPKLENCLEEIKSIPQLSELGIDYDGCTDHETFLYAFDNPELIEYQILLIVDLCHRLEADERKDEATRAIVDRLKQVIVSLSHFVYILSEKNVKLIPLAAPLAHIFGHYDEIPELSSLQGVRGKYNPMAPSIDALTSEESTAFIAALTRAFNREGLQPRLRDSIEQVLNSFSKYEEGGGKENETTCNIDIENYYQLRQLYNNIDFALRSESKILTNEFVTMIFDIALRVHTIENRRISSRLGIDLYEQEVIGKLNIHFHQWQNKINFAVNSLKKIISTDTDTQKIKFAKDGIKFIQHLLSKYFARYKVIEEFPVHS